MIQRWPEAYKASGMRGYLSCQGHIYMKKNYIHEVIVVIQQLRALSFWPPVSYIYTTSEISLSANLSASIYIWLNYVCSVSSSTCTKTLPFSQINKYWCMYVIENIATHRSRCKTSLHLQNLHQRSWVFGVFKGRDMHSHVLYCDCKLECLTHKYLSANKN